MEESLDEANTVLRGMLLKKYVFRVLGVYLPLCEDSWYLPEGWKSTGTTTGGKKFYFPYQFWEKSDEIKSQKMLLGIALWLCFWHTVMLQPNRWITNSLWLSLAYECSPSGHHFFPLHLSYSIITLLVLVLLLDRSISLNAFREFCYISVFVTSFV